MSGDDFQPIGDGPVATVYGGLYLALKVYPEAVGPGALDAFHREQAALEPLRGKASILLVDDVLELPDGRTAVQTELCSPSLADLVDDGGPLLVADAVDLAHTVAEAVAAAHGVGVVHGGLSPHNVLFHPSGAALVSDFGVALRRAFPAEHDYSAPEAVRGGIVDERTDLYGLGRVLHLALTGRPLHEGGDLPPALDKLVSRLLADDPADRPSTVDAVVRRLAAFRDPDPVERRPAPVPAPVAQPRSRPVLRTVVGIVAGGVALAAVPYLVHAGPPKAVSAPAVTTSHPTTSAGPIPVTLAEPADHGTYVDLSWQAANGLAAAVVVTPEGGEPEVRVAQRNRTMRVEVEEDVRYCFRVQATDGALVVESAPRAVRGAVCGT